MALYMSQFSYTAEAWAALARNPVDRRQAISEAVSKLGGKLVSLYYTFGEYDGIVITDMPTAQSAAALSIAVVAPGHLKAIKTVPLLTVEETIETLRMAGGVSYRAPAS